MAKLILPKNEVKIPKGKRVYFLAGPNGGGGDWQATAIQLLIQKDPSCYIVCPCTYESAEKMFACDVIKNTSRRFANQTEWQRYYMQKASVAGAVTFWLPNESKIHPKNPEHGAYALNVYGELGRWSVYSAQSKAKVVVGAENAFPSLKNIKRDFNGDHHKEFKFHESLEETINAAVLLANR